MRSASRWVRGYAIYYLPRPWWGWVGRIEPAERPADPTRLAILAGALLALGGLMLWEPLRADRSQTGQEATEPGSTPLLRASGLGPAIGCASHE